MPYDLGHMNALKSNQVHQNKEVHIAQEHSFMTYDFSSYECFLGDYVKEVHNLGAFFNDICFQVIRMLVNTYM